MEISNSDSLLVHAGTVFDLVWRFDFTTPGFAVLDVGSVVDSHTLRAWMVALKERLSEIGVRRFGKSFVYRFLSRFDQQVTTKFHLDGAPAESLLMLGYESTRVRSRLFLTDYTRAAFDLDISPQQFLADYNPMYVKGEECLAKYVTEVPQPTDGHSRIVLINNSSLPFTDDRTNPLGVMHKAMIVTPDDTERRIVNSMMLTVGGEEIGVDPQIEFVSTDEISQRTY